MSTTTKPAFKWGPAPIKTSWGDGMMVADVGLDADSTVSLYAHADDIAKVDAMFAAPARAGEQREIRAMHAAARHAGWCFAKYADGVVRMEPMAVGEAQAKSAETQRMGPVGYVLMENGKAVAFFDEIPAESHYDPSAYLPVGLMEGTKS